MSAILASMTSRPAGSLREISRQQGAQLRAAFNSGTITSNRARAASVAPAAVTRTAPKPGQVAVPRLTYAQVDELAKRVPTGHYALPKRNPDANNDVTFFKVYEVRGSHRIVMLSGAPGRFQQHPMKLSLQFFALTHLLEDLVAATALFGQTTATCGRCHSPLTRKTSRDRGMGDHCADERAAGR